MFKKFLKLLLFAFWLLTLFLANSPRDFLTYFFLSILTALSIIFYVKKLSFFVLPLFFIPFIDPKLSFFPFLVATLMWLWEKNDKDKLFSFKTFLLTVIVTALIFLIQWGKFKNQTIFYLDYESKQKILRNITLYPDVLTARVFQNKGRIVVDKFNQNFFALIDPNNYFFSYHPREGVVPSQNLIKFPFLGIVFLTFGIFFIKEYKYKRYIFSLILSLLFSLSALSVFDRSDFALWIPLGLVASYGVDVFEKVSPKVFKFFSYLFIIFSAVELFRVFLVFR